MLCNMCIACIFTGSGCKNIICNNLAGGENEEHPEVGVVYLLEMGQSLHLRRVSVLLLLLLLMLLLLMLLLLQATAPRHSSPSCRLENKEGREADVQALMVAALMIRRCDI